MSDQPNDGYLKDLRDLGYRNVDGNSWPQLVRKRAAAFFVWALNGEITPAAFTDRILSDSIPYVHGNSAEATRGGGAEQAEQHLTRSTFPQFVLALRNRNSQHPRQSQVLRAMNKCKQLIGKKSSSQLEKFLLKMHLLTNHNGINFSDAVRPCRAGLAAVARKIRPRLGGTQPRRGRPRAPPHVTRGQCVIAVRRSFQLLERYSDRATMYEDVLAVWKFVLADNLFGHVFGRDHTIPQIATRLAHGVENFDWPPAPGAAQAVRTAPSPPSSDGSETPAPTKRGRNQSQESAATPNVGTPARQHQQSVEAVRPSDNYPMTSASAPQIAEVNVQAVPVKRQRSDVSSIDTTDDHFQALSPMNNPVTQGHTSFSSDANSADTSTVDLLEQTDHDEAESSLGHDGSADSRRGSPMRQLQLGEIRDGFDNQPIGVIIDLDGALLSPRDVAAPDGATMPRMHPDTLSDLNAYSFHAVGNSSDSELDDNGEYFRSCAAEWL